MRGSDALGPVDAGGRDGTGILSGAGRELLDRLAGEDIGPEHALALSQSLRERYPADLVAAALTQQALRIAARAKFSVADQMLFTRAGLEQASSELTAGHAARRFTGCRVIADLCCGIGGNLIALAAAGRENAAIPESSLRVAREGFRDHGVPVVGVDADQVSLEFARHNVAVCAPGAAAAFICADVTRLPLRGVDAVFIDPARRNGHRRLPAGQSRPALQWCLSLTDIAPRVGIKAAPGLPRELVPPGWETEFVAVGRDLKEALLWSPALTDGVTSRATLLPSGETLAAQAGSPAAGDADAGGADAGEAVPLGAPGAYLLDPNPAVTRAGLVAELARLTRTWQIDPMIAFLSADQPVRTPFARTLRVIESAPWHEKRFARRLRELGIGAADIRRRGLAGDVIQIHRRLGLQGPGSATLVLTRVANRPWGLICTPADVPHTNPPRNDEPPLWP
jgi:SAM-dependent methyltransferase